MSLTGNGGQVREARVADIGIATQYRFTQTDGTTVVSGPSSAGIVANGIRRYKANVTLPSPTGFYEIQWDDGSGSWVWTEDVEVGTVQLDVSPTLIDLARKFPSGTVVGAYAGKVGPANGEGPPIGSATRTGTVDASGTVTFFDLLPGVDYFIGAQVSGTWTWVRYHA